MISGFLIYYYFSDSLFYLIFCLFLFFILFFNFFCFSVTNLPFFPTKFLLYLLFPPFSSGYIIERRAIEKKDLWNRKNWDGLLDGLLPTLRKNRARFWYYSLLLIFNMSTFPTEFCRSRAHERTFRLIFLFFSFSCSLFYLIFLLFFYSKDRRGFIEGSSRDRFIRNRMNSMYATISSNGSRFIVSIFTR